MTFEQWLDKVDDCFIKVTDLDRYSWPDQDYWNMFDSGLTPMEALLESIENEYGEAGLIAFGLEIA